MQQISAKPLVSIILTCYNQASFVAECLWSVRNQSYQHWELLVIDNNSTDNSLSIIQQNMPAKAILITNKQNLGLCKAFNMALQKVSGKYVIDLAADDVMPLHKLKKQVSFFEKQTENVGVIFSDVIEINQNSLAIGTFYKRKNGELVQQVPSGMIFKELLANYIVCTSSMMTRKTVFDDLKGYNEALSYEDFDFFMRAGRKYAFIYQNDLLMLHRKLETSSSADQFRKKNKALESTWLIWQNTSKLLQSSEEISIFTQRTSTFIRRCWLTEHFELAHHFELLLNKFAKTSLCTKGILLLCRWKIPVNWLYLWWLKLQKRLG